MVNNIEINNESGVTNTGNKKDLYAIFSFFNYFDISLKEFETKSNGNDGITLSILFYTIIEYSKNIPISTLRQFIWTTTNIVENSNTDTIIDPNRNVSMEITRLITLTNLHLQNDKIDIITYLINILLDVLE